jgi:hypothetical protein
VGLGRRYGVVNLLTFSLIFYSVRYLLGVFDMVRLTGAYTYTDTYLRPLTEGSGGRMKRG